jgi:hypothetical protein
MTVEVRYAVMTPEAGVERLVGVPPSPPPAGVSGLRPGSGTTSPRPPNPTPQRSLPMAKRLDSLENKTVYLVDTGFGGSNKFMQQLQNWFAAHMPSVKTIRKRKPGHVFADDTTGLWEEIKAKGDAAVLGVAG